VVAAVQKICRVGRVEDELEELFKELAVDRTIWGKLETAE
jgi:hypothetical protein